MTFALPVNENAKWCELSQEEQTTLVDCLRYLAYRITFDELAAIHPQHIQGDLKHETTH